jgi:hypothetical protein
MELRYGYQKLQTGEKAIVSLKLAPGVEILRTKIELKPGEGLALLAPPLRIPPLREVDWKISVLGKGEKTMEFIAGDFSLSKKMPAADGIERIYPVTARASFFNSLRYPGERPLPQSSPILTAKIDYPTRLINFFGLKLHWAILYFALAIVFGFLLKRPFRVDF